MNGWSITLGDIEFTHNTPGRASHALTERLRAHFKSPRIYKRLVEFFVKRRLNTFTLCYHTHDSRASQKGFPDLVLVHPGSGRIIFAELKTDTTYATLEQRLWLAALECVALADPETIMVAVWRPRDWQDIVQALGGLDSRLYA